MEKDILMHYRQEERPFIQRITEFVERTDLRQVPVLTDFLDPRQVMIADRVARTIGNVHVYCHGGYEGAERQRVLFLPMGWEAEEADFSLSYFRIQADERGCSLQHGDYLGALLGLGLKRHKLGDFSVQQDGADFVVTGDIADYMRTHLYQVGRIHITLTEITKEQFRIPKVILTEKETTVMSLRLDAVAAEGFALSRSKIVDPIRGGKVQLNWCVTEDPSTQVQEGDVISLRGKGRIRVLEIGKVTKKGRTVIRIGKYV